MMAPPEMPRWPKLRYRVAFMGTPEYAVSSLRALLATQDVVGVFTQPDRPSGRGRHVVPSPVAREAAGSGLPLLQPRTLRGNSECLTALHDWVPDVIVVAAYGLILPRSVFEAVPGGALNVHASLLPRWRGASPVACAILAGDGETGVTIMRIDEGLDTGPIIAQEVVPIDASDTTGSLSARLAEVGAELLVRTLPPWMAGEIVPAPQDNTLATMAPRLAREDGRLEWTQPATVLERRVRAMHPWPGAYCEFDAERLIVHEATALNGDGSHRAGLVLDVGGCPAVATGEGRLRLDSVQPAGKRPMPGDAYARGRRDLFGRILNR